MLRTDFRIFYLIKIADSGWVLNLKVSTIMLAKKIAKIG
jgi:hypothetical protein